MNDAPRDPDEAIVSRDGWIQTAVLGAILTIAIFGAFALALHWLDLDNGAALTVAFLTLSLGHLWNVFNLRDPGLGPILNDVSRNKHVWGAIVVCLALIALALWLPGLSGLLKLAPPGQAGLTLAAIASVRPLVLGQIWITVARRANLPMRRT
nr:cation-translocating P-type ATPase C-terminal domain-containing protein [Palleronia pontilimi]